MAIALKVLYHVACILILSLFLYVFFLFTDMIGTHHLASLLLNVDFLPGLLHADLMVKILVHVATTTIVYIVFQALRDSYVYPAGILIMIVMFAVLYPSLISWSFNPIYQFHWNDYFAWMLGHTLFIFLAVFLLRFQKDILFHHHKKYGK